DAQIKDYKAKNESGNIFHFPGRFTLLTSIKELNDEWDFEVSGSVSQIITTDLKNFDDKFHRVIIPVDVSQKLSFRDYQHWWYKADIKAKNCHLIKITIKDSNFDLYTFQIEDKVFWGIDSFQICTFRIFQEIAFSILNTFGFIEGDLHLNEAYYIACDSDKFDEKLDLFYTSMRESILTGYSIITSNPYSVLVPLAKNKGEKINHDEIKKWYEKLPLFPADLLSKLAEFFQEHDSLSRAALIVLEANKQPLELKAASYCVAYEAICHTIKNELGIRSPNVIETKSWDDIIKPAFLELITTLNKESKIDANQFRILSNKLNNLNQPTNRDALTAPFKNFGYELNSIEYGCIDDRNRFLHGKLPVNERNEDEAFKELYFISMTIHKLIYVLMLKLISYNGYIINYPKLHEHMTGKVLNENVLVKI